MPRGTCPWASRANRSGAGGQAGSRSGSLGRLDGRAAGAELLGLPAGVLECRPGVGVDQVAGLDVSEPIAQESALVLCLQQSPGDSTGPQVDVSAARFRDGPLDRDVGQLDAPTRSEDTDDLGEDCILVGVRSMTPFEMTTSKLESENGRRSA